MAMDEHLANGDKTLLALELVRQDVYTIMLFFTHLFIGITKP
jgi:hypothetical protein